MSTNTWRWLHCGASNFITNVGCAVCNNRRGTSPRAEPPTPASVMTSDDGAAVQASTRIVDELERLAKLRDAGILTDADVQTLKARLLAPKKSETVEPEPVPTVGPRQRTGRWEYSTFVEPLGEVKIKGAGWKFSGGLSHEKGEALIEEAAKRLVRRLAPGGWEPDEPYDAGSLTVKGHVRMTNATPKLGKWGSGEDFRLHEVRMNFRRWVTD